MTQLLQFVLTGVVTGCAYGLLATGFVVIHRVTRVVNFAQGGFAIFAGYVTYGALHRGLPHGAAEVLAVAAATVLGGLVGGLCVGRRGTPPLASLIMTIGVGFCLYALEVTVWGDLPLQFQELTGVFTAGAISLQRQYVLIAVVAVVTFVALALFFGRTYLGKVFTACASNPLAARLAGISVTWVGIAAFALGGTLGGVAGVLFLPLGSLNFDGDVSLAVNGFAAAIFGGLQRPWLAFGGGIMLGVVEALAAGYGRASYERGVALIVLLGILVWQAARRRELA